MLRNKTLPVTPFSRYDCGVPVEWVCASSRLHCGQLLLGFSTSLAQSHKTQPRSVSEMQLSGTHTIYGSRVRTVMQGIPGRPTGPGANCIGGLVFHYFFLGDLAT